MNLKQDLFFLFLIDLTYNSLFKIIATMYQIMYANNKWNNDSNDIRVKGNRVILLL